MYAVDTYGDYTLLNASDCNSPHVSTAFITPHTPNNLNFRYFYNHPYFIPLFNIIF